MAAVARSRIYFIHRPILTSSDYNYILFVMKIVHKVRRNQKIYGGGAKKSRNSRDESGNKKQRNNYNTSNISIMQR